MTSIEEKYALTLEITLTASILTVEDAITFNLRSIAEDVAGPSPNVRETWAAWSHTYGTAPQIIYKADGYSQSHKMKWRPSIHMPREAARIFLLVTGVRVERLQDITELDILEKEGVTVDFPQPKPSYMSLAYTETRLKPAVRKAFSDLLDKTVNPADRSRYGWEANPWVWVIEFERISKEEALANG